MEFINEMLEGLQFADLKKTFTDEDRERLVASKQGCGMVLTSTQVDETAQHFYRKNGYKDCGSLVMNIPGYEQPMEIFLSKGI